MLRGGPGLGAALSVRRLGHARRASAATVRGHDDGPATATTAWAVSRKRRAELLTAAGVDEAPLEQ